MHIRGGGGGGGKTQGTCRQVKEMMMTTVSLKCAERLDAQHAHGTGWKIDVDKDM